jgi:bacterioferritin-associated ferredoxin
MIICICNGISEKDMEEAVSDGHCNFDEMLKSKNVCFQCYACEEV